jgi:hypothetical protein
MSKNKLYLFIIVACLTGFSYLFYSINHSKSTSLNLCMVKNVTGYPCPSCGTTRAIQLLLKNNWMASIQMNPFGILVAMLMVVLPLWIVWDTIAKKETFFKWYKKTEAILRTKWLAVFLIILVILNWIWNVKKGL